MYNFIINAHMRPFLFSRVERDGRTIYLCEICQLTPVVSLALIISSDIDLKTGLNNAI